MKTHPCISRSAHTRAKSGFTMVEIAIAIGVIAFALIAIIGILPSGLQTQRDNREETIVVQDGRVLIEAIKSGAGDVASDLGEFVVSVDGNPANPPALSTPDLIKLLSDATHRIVFNSFSGAIASRRTDLGFRYQVYSTVTNAVEFANTPLSNQVHEVRLLFLWPLNAKNEVRPDANRYTARVLISGAATNGYLYTQQFLKP
jgi:type II secretory pathway pseudopilin PulG